MKIDLTGFLCLYLLFSFSGPAASAQQNPTIQNPTTQSPPATQTPPPRTPPQQNPTTQNPPATPATPTPATPTPATPAPPAQNPTTQAPPAQTPDQPPATAPIVVAPAGAPKISRTFVCPASTAFTSASMAGPLKSSRFSTRAAIPASPIIPMSPCRGNPSWAKAPVRRRPRVAQHASFLLPGDARRGGFHHARDAIDASQTYTAGTLVSTDYNVQALKLSFDNLTWPYPLESRKFRFKTLYQVQYVAAKIGFDAPLFRWSMLTETSLSMSMATLSVMPPGNQMVRSAHIRRQRHRIPDAQYPLRGQRRWFRDSTPLHPL